MRERTCSFDRTDKRPLLNNWLASYRLESLLDVLTASGYDDLDQIVDQAASAYPITEEILQEIGINRSGLRRRLLAALESELRALPTVKSPRREPTNRLTCCFIPLPINLEVTSLPSLKRWLEQLSLGELCVLFEEEGYDELETLFGLMHSSWPINDSVLREIGVQKLGHRHRILARLQEDCLAVKTLRRQHGGLSSRQRKEEIFLERQRNANNCFVM